MPTLFCGNCGYPATDPAGCSLCQGPVFDLSTPRGVIDCRTYRSLRSEQAEQVSTGYVSLFVGLGVMAISFPSQGQFESWAEEMTRDLN